MKFLGMSVIITILLTLIAYIVIGPLLSNLGYSSVESTYHLQTHALLVMVIFTIILCTMFIVKYDNQRD